MFLPFLKISVCLLGEGTKENADKEGFARIQPSEIESFKEGYHFGTIITFKSGNIEMVKISADDLAQTIAGYWAQINKQMNEAQQKAAGAAIKLLQ